MTRIRSTIERSRLDLPAPRPRLAALRANRWVGSVAAIIGLVTFTAACSTSSPRANRETSVQANVEHVVLVWLKDTADTATRDALAHASLEFVAIDGVESVRVGGPIGSDRPIVDDGFDLAIVVSLRDRAALAAYLEHPLHVAAGRELLLPAAERVLVYDVEVAGRARPSASTGSPRTP